MSKCALLIQSTEGELGWEYLGGKNGTTHHCRGENPIAKESRSKWVEAGFVSVDTGEILIADPAAVLSDEGRIAIDKWFENVGDQNFDKFECSYTLQDGQKVEQEGLLSRTGYGDGHYRIWARINEDGRVAELRIDFETTYGYDDESKEMHDISQKETMRRLIERQQDE